MGDLRADLLHPWLKLLRQKKKIQLASVEQRHSSYSWDKTLVHYEIQIWKNTPSKWNAGRLNVQKPLSSKTRLWLKTENDFLVNITLSSDACYKKRQSWHADLSSAKNGFGFPGRIKQTNTKLSVSLNELLPHGWEQLENYWRSRYGCIILIDKKNKKNLSMLFSFYSNGH